jgi:zinc D-Ala-D-Ala carboxypeptidase
MGNISTHITFKEATLSPTATRLGINNTPSVEALASMKLVAENCFEPLRRWYGKQIKINSFYRSPELNKAIGGASNSQHCLGEAIDIDADKDNLKLFKWLLNNVEFDMMIFEFGTRLEPDWIHISYTRKRANRSSVLMAVKENGKTVYKPFDYSILI